MSSNNNKKRSCDDAESSAPQAKKTAVYMHSDVRDNGAGTPKLSTDAELHVLGDAAEINESSAESAATAAAIAAAIQDAPCANDVTTGGNREVTWDDGAASSDARMSEPRVEETGGMNVDDNPSVVAMAEQADRREVVPDDHVSVAASHNPVSTADAVSPTQVRMNSGEGDPDDTSARN